MSIKSLAHACIKTSDLNATLGFYCDLLGLKKVFDFTREGKTIGFYLGASPNTFIEVFQVDTAPQNSNERCLHHFCLETDDIAGLRAVLVEHGYTPGEIKSGADSSLQFWVKDPNGLDLEFHQYTGQSSQFTGKNVEVDW